MFPPLPEIASRIGLLLAALLVSFCGGEFALRRLDLPVLHQVGWHTGFEVGYPPPQPYQSINQLWFRGRDISYDRNDLVVVLTGDSFVECPSCPDGRTPEEVLEHHLSELSGKAGCARRVRVFSLGGSGFGQDQELLALQNYFAGYRADLVIEWETLSNDVWENIFQTRKFTPLAALRKPTFRISGEDLLGPDDLWLNLARESRVADILFRTAVPDVDLYWERYLPPRIDGAQQVPPDKAAESLLETTEDVGSAKSNWFLAASAPSPRRQYGIALAGAILRRMRSEAGGHNSAFAAFSHRIDSPEAIAAADTGTPRLDYLRLVREGRLILHTPRGYFEAALANSDEAAKAINEGIDYFEIPVTDPLPFVSATDLHLSRSGNEQVLSDLARALSAKGLLQCNGAR